MSATEEQLATVVADQREGNFDATDPDVEILLHVWDTLTVESPAPVGASTIDGDDELADAYRAVLADLNSPVGAVMCRDLWRWRQ
jgi:hypothetical protein